MDGEDAQSRRTIEMVQVHAVQLALMEQAQKTHAAQIAHLDGTTITEEELTAALGPVRGEQALQKQAMDTIKQTLTDTATKDQLTSAIALVRNDLAAQTRDMNDVQGTLTWIGRLVIGGVVTGILALIWQVAK